MPNNTEFNLDGKVALITGGNGGIGLGFGLALAKAGCRVCLWGTNEEKNKAALEQLNVIGGEHLALRCDVGDEQQVDVCFEQTLQHFGRVDGCFANAGISGFSKFPEMTLDEWRRVQRVNQEGVFLVFRAASRHMVERAENGDAFGRLVVTSSTASRMGAANSAHYGASKSAVNGLSKALAVELARYDITSNTILPGWVETELVGNAVHSDKFNQTVISRVPMRRWGQPDEFGGIAVYLMSDASSFHTGDEIMIDGGYTNY